MTFKMFFRELSDGFLEFWNGGMTSHLKERWRHNYFRHYNRTLRKRCALIGITVVVLVTARFIGKDDIKLMQIDAGAIALILLIYLILKKKH